MLKTCIAIAAIACAASAQAQSTLGDILDKGASKATAAELQAMGTHGFVRDTADANARMYFNPNGTVVGTVVNKQGHGASEAAGTWAVDASGKRCVDVTLPTFNMKWKECGYSYKLDGKLYSVASDSDRQAPVTVFQ
jgi:hypothetical protein